MVKSASSKKRSRNSGYKPDTSAKLSISLKNEATRTQLSANKKIDSKGKASGPNEKWFVGLVELQPKKLVLDVPSDFCSQGQKLTLGIELRSDVENIKIEIVAKVVMQTFESGKNERESVVLEFVDYDESDWKQLCSVLQERQDDVMRVFTAMRAVE